MLYSVPAERMSCKPEPFSSDSITTFQICHSTSAGCCYLSGLPFGLLYSQWYWWNTHVWGNKAPEVPSAFVQGHFVKSAPGLGGWVLEHGAHSTWFPMDTHGPPAAVLHLQPCRARLQAPGDSSHWETRLGESWEPAHISGWQWQEWEIELLLMWITAPLVECIHPPCEKEEELSPL